MTLRAIEGTNLSFDPDEKKKYIILELEDTSTYRYYNILIFIIFQDPSIRYKFEENKR